MRNIISTILLKLLTKCMNVDRDQPIYILFLGNDEIQIQEQGKQPINYQFK